MTYEYTIILAVHLTKLKIISQGIPVDSHVRKWALAMKWVPDFARSNEEIRYALQEWVPRTLWQRVNIHLASMGQMFATTKTRQFILSAADLQVRAGTLRVVLDNIIPFYTKQTIILPEEMPADSDEDTTF